MMMPVFLKCCHHYKKIYNTENDIIVWKMMPSHKKKVQSSKCGESQAKVQSSKCGESQVTSRLSASIDQHLGWHVW